MMIEEEVRERARIREENKRILKEELSGKEVIIKTNIIRDKERKYFVEDVKEARIKQERGNVLGVRLTNPLFKEEEHPFIRYPNSIIAPERIGEKKKKILIVYLTDYDLERDFRRLHKKTKQDLTITIIYPG
ncbi:MAG: hypothetical protein AB1595_05095 [bacterium]